MRWSTSVPSFQRARVVKTHAFFARPKAFPFFCRRLFPRCCSNSTFFRQYPFLRHFPKIQSPERRGAVLLPFSFGRPLFSPFRPNQRALASNRASNRPLPSAQGLGGHELLLLSEEPRQALVAQADPAAEPEAEARGCVARCCSFQVGFKGKSDMICRWNTMLGGQKFPYTCRVKGPPSPIHVFARALMWKGALSLENGLDALFVKITLSSPCSSFSSTLWVLFEYSTGVDPQKSHPNRFLDSGSSGRA